MKYIEEYNSIRAFKADLNSPECICAAQVFTPVGDAMGYQQDGEFVFTVSGTVISEDSLRTIDLSSFNEDQISSDAVQTFINTCNEGDTMIFNPDVGIVYMDTLNINDKAHWDGFALTLGVKEDDIDTGVQVWYTDGSSCMFRSISVVSEPTTVVKVKLGKDITGSSGLFNPFVYEGVTQLRYIVTSQNLTGFGPSAFGGLSKLQSLTLNNPKPPSLYEIDSLGDANCQRIYVPKGSKKEYIIETNWKEPDIANKIYEV
jgi:hypothetical protein